MVAMRPSCKHDTSCAVALSILSGRGTPTCHMLNLVLRGLLVVAAIGGCQQPSHQTQKLEAEQNWKRGRAEFKSQLAKQHIEWGRINEAIPILEEAAALDPTTQVYDILLSKCYLEQGDLESAWEATHRTASPGDTSAELEYMRGLIAERRSQLREALRHYLAAAKIEPTNADYAMAAAEGLVSIGQPGEAQRFLSGPRQNDQLILLRAGVWVLLQDLEQAASDFEAVKYLLIENRLAAEEYGLVLVRLGHYAEAMAVLRPLVESSANPAAPESERPSVSAAVIRALATCHVRLGFPDRASAILQDHLESSPKDARAWWSLAKILIQAGDWQRARTAIERGESLTPRKAAWKLLRACLAWHRGDLDDTTALLMNISVTRPEDAVIHLLQARAFEQRGESSLAREHYEAALRLAPDDPRVNAAVNDIVASK